MTRTLRYLFSLVKSWRTFLVGLNTLSFTRKGERFLGVEGHLSISPFSNFNSSHFFQESLRTMCFEKPKRGHNYSISRAQQSKTKGCLLWCLVLPLSSQQRDSTRLWLLLVSRTVPLYPIHFQFSCITRFGQLGSNAYSTILPKTLELPFDVFCLMGTSIESLKWSPENHMNFNSSFRKSVQEFLLCLKRIQRETALRVPRPIIYLLIRESMSLSSLIKPKETLKEPHSTPSEENQVEFNI